MSPVRNVLICSAGISSRLGLGTPSCLSPVEGRPLVHWQLDQLEDIENVVVVVGYHAPQIMASVMAKRPDAVFVINHDHEHTSALESMMMGAVYFREPFIYMDGGLIVDGEAIERMAEAPSPAVGIRRTYSDNPVCVRLGTNGHSGMVTGFTREPMEYEWTGLAKLGPEHVKRTSGEAYVYQALEHFLPVHAVEIDCVEIDTQQDYDEAQAWMRKRQGAKNALKIAA
jgi:choline kinase